jgi:localization factor PodJL
MRCRLASAAVLLPERDGNAGASMKSAVRVDLDDVRLQILGAARGSGWFRQWLDGALTQEAAQTSVRWPGRGEPRGVPAPQTAATATALAAARERLDRLVVALDAVLTRDAAGAALSEVKPAIAGIEPALREIESQLASITLNRVTSTTPHRRIPAPLRTAEQKPANGRQTLQDLGPQPYRHSPDQEQSAATLPTPPRQNAQPYPPQPATNWTVHPAAHGERDLLHLGQRLVSITQQMELLRDTPAREDGQAAGRDYADPEHPGNEVLPRRLDPLQAELRSGTELFRRDGGGSLGSLAEGGGNLGGLASAENLTRFGEELNRLSRKMDLVAAGGADCQTWLQLETAISELRELADRFASSDALSALGAEMRAIGLKLERLTVDQERNTGFEELNRRLEALARSLEGHSAKSEHVVPAEFEALIRTLADKLESIPRWGDNQVEQLEHRIIALAQKLDAADLRLGQLTAIEDAIAAMMHQLKGARTAAVEAAEFAARMVACELLAAKSETEEDVDGLHHDVAELRTAQANIDRRTEQTLEAVHRTLERLVDRLGLIPSERSAAGAVNWPETPADQSSASSSDETKMLPPPAEDAATPMLNSQGRRRRLDPLGGQDPPLGPEPGALPRRAMATPAERIAASKAMLGPAEEPPEEGRSAQANFIAAARRAAQAAATADRPERPDAKAVEPLAAIKAAIAKRRGPLMIGMGLFVLALGTVQLVAGLIGSSGHARPSLHGPGLKETPLFSRAVPENVPALSRTARADPSKAQNTPATAGGRSEVLPATGALFAPVPVGEAPNNEALPNPVGQSAEPFAPPRPLPDAMNTFAASHVALATSLVDANAGELGARAVMPNPDTLPVAIGSPNLRAAALADDPAAEYEIALRFSEGHGVPQSFEDAARWFERAANHGLAPAQYRLGSLYEKGQGVKKELETARKLYFAAAEQGSGKAMHNLAVLYAEGTPGKLDYKTASLWFRRAAVRGVRDSQYNLGILCARGIGLEQNLPESYKWFSLAAQQGDADATKKRDEVAARLDPQSLIAAKLAVQTFVTEPEPEQAVSVKAPPGGWDQTGWVKPKPLPRRLGST